MSDENSDQGTSGNRWEPDPTASQPIAEPVQQTAAAVPPSRPAWLTRARTVVAGGAAAVLLAGGLGGFALGRATAGTDDGGRVTQQGVPAGFDQEGAGQGQGGPGGGPMIGQLPDGQVPGMPGQDDEQDDGTDGTDSSDT